MGRPDPARHVARRRHVPLPLSAPASSRRTQEVVGLRVSAHANTAPIKSFKSIVGDLDLILFLWVDAYHQVDMMYATALGVILRVAFSGVDRLGFRCHRRIAVAGPFLNWRIGDAWPPWRLHLVDHTNISDLGRGE